MATATMTTTTATEQMSIPLLGGGKTHFTYSPIPLSEKANPAMFKDMGRQVHGYNPDTVTPEQTQEIIEMLYRVSLPRALLLVACR